MCACVCLCSANRTHSFILPVIVSVFGLSHFSTRSLSSFTHPQFKHRSFVAFFYSVGLHVHPNVIQIYSHFHCHCFGSLPLARSLFRSHSVLIFSALNSLKISMIFDRNNSNFSRSTKKKEKRTKL